MSAFMFIFNSGPSMKDLENELFLSIFIIKTIFFIFLYDFIDVFHFYETIDMDTHDF